MWVRIKGVLYNLALVESIDFSNKGNFIQLYFTGVVPVQYGTGYKNNSVRISFNSAGDALIAYNHIISTIDIPQLQQEDFHDD